ncbi:MAG: aldo/keto reductase [Actinobacteria bacterium]|nr:aldo/keto reductase [Actinomycetota bacterium]
MKYRILGKTGFKVSEVSLGTWQLGGKWGEKFNPKIARKILENAVENGINFFDTADVYNNGKSEIAIGKFLKETTQKVYVATKCGRKLNPHVSEGYNKKNITNFINESLTRMEIEAIDLIQLHCPPAEVYNRGEVFSVLDDLEKAGKILHYGVSVEKVEEALKAIEYPGVASIQIIYNIFRSKPREKFFEEAFKKNVGTIIRVPLASGLLTGKLRKDTRYRLHDHRLFNRNGKFFDKGETFSGVPYEAGLEAVEELKKIFNDEDLTKYAIRWILDNKYISCVIPGMSNEVQVKSNVAASEMHSLSDSQSEAVNLIYDRYIRKFVHHLW